MIWIVQNNIQSKIKINDLLFGPIYSRHVGSFADCSLFMFLYVVAAKVVIYFSDNEKGLKVYR